MCCLQHRIGLQMKKKTSVKLEQHCMGKSISADRAGGRWPARARRCGRVADRHLSLSLGPIALSLRPSAARSSSSCKVKVTSDVLCYNRWGALQQVQCLVESGRDTRFVIIAARASPEDCATACDIRTVKSSRTGC